MSNVIAEVCEWPDSADDPAVQSDEIVVITIEPGSRVIEFGIDVEMKKAGRVFIRFKPEELMAALAAAMFDRDE